MCAAYQMKLPTGTKATKWHFCFTSNLCKTVEELKIKLFWHYVVLKTLQFAHKIVAELTEVLIKFGHSENWD